MTRNSSTTQLRKSRGVRDLGNAKQVLLAAKIHAIVLIGTSQRRQYRLGRFSRNDRTSKVA